MKGMKHRIEGGVYAMMVFERQFLDWGDTGRTEEETYLTQRLYLRMLFVGVSPRLDYCILRRGS